MHMKNTAKTHHHHNERGVALLTALAFLIIITLLGLSAMRTSTLELTMAGNEQASTEAVQSAQSAIDSLLDTANFPVITGYVGCYNMTGGDCPATSDTLPSTITGLSNSPVSDSTNSVKIRLVSDGSFTCRACASSANIFDGAVFNISSRYDNTDNRGGRAEVNEGFLMLVPKN